MTKRRDAPVDLVAVLLERLSTFARQQDRELVAVLRQTIGAFVEQLSPLERVHAPPLTLRPSRRLDRTVDVLAGRVRDLRDDFLRRRILHLGDRARGALDVLAADVELLHLLLLTSD